MANTIPGPNMGLIIPVPGQQVGPDWATNVSSDLQIIDGHNHSSVGVKIPTAGLNIDATLSMNGYTLDQANQVNLKDTTTVLDTTNKGSLYRDGINLYYNNGNGDPIQITNGTTVNAGSGNIGGLPSGDANVNYNSGTYTFTSSTAPIKASVDCGALLLENAGSLNQLSVTAPATLSGGSYGLVLPDIPATAKFLTIDNAGAITGATDYPLTTTGIANSTILDGNIASKTITNASIKNGTITTSEIASSTILGSNIAADTITNTNIYSAAAIARSKLASPAVYTSFDINTNNGSSGTSWISVGSGTISVTGSNIYFTATRWASSEAFFSLTYTSATTGIIATGYVRIIIDGVESYQTKMSGYFPASGNTFYFPINAITYLKTGLAAGSHTYDIQIKSTSGAATFGISCNLSLVGI